MPKLDFNDLQKHAGISFETGIQPRELTSQIRNGLAMDASLVTSPNAGVPALFTTYIDPKVIEVLVEPMKMATAFGEIHKGDWSTEEVMFPVIENVGEVSTYGDFSENAMSDTNVNYPSRQSYHYQTNVRVGERELAIAGAAKIDWASRKQISAALALNKFQNKSYIYGIEGKKNYGMLNDPNLLPAITGPSWENLDADATYSQFTRLFNQLLKQSGGLIDRSTEMTVLLSPAMDGYMTKTNTYGINVTDLIKKNFPNVKFVTIPEYATEAGEYLQLIVDSYEGQPTVECAFTIKMRVHALIQHTSGYEQKRSQGTLGTIIYRPIFVASMIVS